MKKTAKRLQLNRETLHGLNLRQAVGAATVIHCPETEYSGCITDCDRCGNTNYASCLCSIVGC